MTNIDIEKLKKDKMYNYVLYAAVLAKKSQGNQLQGNKFLKISNILCHFEMSIGDYLVSGV